jgi:hypothetical protein
MQNRKRDRSFYYYLDFIECSAKKYEDDLVATRRYVYVGTDGSYRLYKEKATDKVLRVLMPQLH